ncbi:MAG: PAS domain S-box protein, partial [Candidatus Margulisbacteria bacterium]|nr:PAS domain S-box protein [Candidatus Margulisiibacteriota bacterium]
MMVKLTQKQVKKIQAKKSSPGRLRQLEEINQKLQKKISRLKKNIGDREIKRKLQDSVAELNAMIENIPLVIMLLDKHRKVRKINIQGTKFVNNSMDQILGKRAGEAMKCINASDDPRGCGFGPSCQDCTLRKLIADTFSLQCTFHRVEVNLSYKLKHSKKEEVFLVSTSFIKSSAEPLCLVCLENISDRKQKEKLIRDSEEKYRSLAEQSNALICEVDEQGKFLYINAAYKNILGYKPQDLIGHTAYDIGKPEEKKAAEKKLQKAIGTDIPQENIWNFKDKSGNWHNINCFSRSYVTPAGEKRINVVSFDITEQKRMENALWESENRYRSLFEGMLHGFAYCQMIYGEAGEPVDFIYIDVNQAFEKLTGLKNVIGKKVTKVIPGIKEQNPELFETYGKVAINGKPATFESEIKALNIWVHVSIYSPLKGYFVAIFDNITARKHFEQKLLESDQRTQLQANRLKVILDTAPAIIWIAQDKDCKVITGNKIAQELLALPEHSNMSKSQRKPQKLAHFECYKNNKKLGNANLPLQRVAVTGKPLRDYHFDLIFNDGRKKSLLGNVTPMFDLKGKPAGAIGVFIDITRRRDTERLLSHQQATLKSVIESSEEPIFSVDRNYNFTSFNFKQLEVIKKLFGSTIEIGGNMLNFKYNTADCLDAKANLKRVFNNEKVREETYLDQKKGPRLYFEISYNPIVHSSGEVTGASVFVRDLTERKNREKELSKLNRTLNALNNSNRLMMRAENEAEYLRKVCEIITKDCGYAMVWIGYADNDKNKTIRPVAHAGFEQGYLEKLNLTWADKLRGWGPTGTAIRTGEPSFCRNMLTDPNFKPWRAEAIKRNYASSMVIPFLDRKKAFGAITIYSREADPFTDNEIELLKELAADVVHSIKTIRLNKEHKKASKALKESEERYKNLVTSFPEAIIVHHKGIIKFVNPAAIKLFGATDIEQLLEKPLLHLIPEKLHYIAKQNLISSYNEKTSKVNLKFVRIDETSFDADISGRAIVYHNSPAIQIVVRDVTERKKAEEILKRDKDIFEKQVKERSEELTRVQMELERAQRLSDIGTLSATVAHELRNPLG